MSAEPIAETPRSNANTEGQLNGIWCVPRDFARQLERELTAATEALEKAKAELEYLSSTMLDTAGTVAKVIRERNAAELALEQSGKREAALREALAGLLKHEAPAKAYGPESLVIGKGYVLAAINTALSQQAPTNDTTGSTPQG